MRAILFGLAIAGVVVVGCNTRFTGEPTLPQGPTTCVQVCTSWNMELAGMVYMGDHYTDGCICTVPGRPAVGIAAAAGVAAAAAVHETTEQNNDAAAASQRQ